VLTTSYTCLYFNKLIFKIEEGEDLFRWQSLEILQRRINDEFVGLALPYYIRIDDINILTGTIEYVIELRCRFAGEEDAIERAHEIAEKILKNMSLDIS
jgi:hypothetical protein